MATAEPVFEPSDRLTASARLPAGVLAIAPIGAEPHTIGRFVGSAGVWQYLYVSALFRSDLIDDAFSLLADDLCLCSAVLHPGGRTSSLGLPIAFAEHLSDARTASGTEPTRCVVAASCISLRSGVIRVPHLLTVRCDTEVRDRVVWEFMPEATARGWLDSALPDLAFFEEHLDRLLLLRRNFRDKTLPHTESFDRLRELLEDKYMSIRLVLRNAPLFTEILGSADW